MEREKKMKMQHDDIYRRDEVEEECCQLLASSGGLMCFFQMLLAGRGGGGGGTMADGGMTPSLKTLKDLFHSDKVEQSVDFAKKSLCKKKQLRLSRTGKLSAVFIISDVIPAALWWW